MLRKLLREFYLLPRGEQRALLLLALLVFLTLGFRMLVARMPERSPSGLEQFREDALMISAMLARTDSLKGHTREKSVNARADRAMGDQPIHAPVIHLNTADSTALLPLPGVGPVFAGRIIKYRRLLGGYYKAEQLREVYGMKEETVNLISPRLQIDSIGLVKLHVNSCSFRDLLRHPYLEYEHVKALVNYINSEGGIDSLGEIRHHFLLADSVLNRIGPYLDFSP